MDKSVIVNLKDIEQPYLNKSNEVLVEYKNRIMSLLEKDHEVLVDENIILEKEKIIDDYFNQDIREVL